MFQFREIVDELTEGIEEVMDAQFYGVLVAVSETSAKLSCKQDQFIQVVITQCLLYYICLCISHSSSWNQPVLSNEGKVSCSRKE